MSRRARKYAVSSSTGRGRSRMCTENGFEAQGGYMAAKMRKLEEQYQMDAEPADSASNIFKGVAIHVNGYTKPSSDELKRLVVSRGGRYEHFLYKTKVTHIIATNLTNSKIKDLMKNGKVVRPEWITDSVDAGRLLSYSKYLLYTAQGGRQRGLETFSTHSVTHHSTMASDNTTSTNNTSTITRDTTDVSHLDDNTTVNIHSCNRLDKDSEEVEDTELYFDESIILENSKEVKGPNKEACIQKEVVPCNNVAKSNNKVISPDAAVNGHGTSKQTQGMAMAGEPAFLNEFYSNSRLHHLSTWKSEWRAYVKTLQGHRSDFPGRVKLIEMVSRRQQDMEGMLGNGYHYGTKSGKPSRIVMHIDMDCFFVSVGLRKRPDLRGKPVAVTHSRGKGLKGPIPGSNPTFEHQQWELKRNQGGKKGKKHASHHSMLDEDDDEDETVEEMNVIESGQKMSESFHSMAEIASCSYEARQSGVRNGMFMGKARQLCPELQTIPYDFDGYQEVSKILYDTVARYTHDIEAVSCDEMLVDCTDLLSITGAEPLDFASLLRQELLEQTSCPASAGMGSNILLAKMATRKAKPNGQYFLQPDEVLEFISDQTIQNIPGVGWSMAKKLKTMNIEKCGDLQKVSLGVLQKEFGPKTGQSLYRYCRGEDDRPIKIEQERKSVSAEINYGIRFKHAGEADKFLSDLSEEVHTRLKNIDRKGKTITLKVMVRREDAPVETSKFMGHGICNNLSKSVTLPMATDDPKIISRECIGILHAMKIKASDLRGIGIQLQRLEPGSLGSQRSTKGAQSILNFTVAKQVTPDKSESESPNTSAAKPLSNPDDLDLSAESHSDTPESHKSEKTSSAGHSGDSDSSGHSGDVDPTSLPGDAKSDFLGGYCHNIVDELSRRKTAKRFLPPLPSLPDISGSPTDMTISSGGGRISYGGGDSGGDINTSGINDYFPSPSQIDPSVLRELPSDIRKQIEAEMVSRRKRNVHSNSTNQNTPCSSKTDSMTVAVDERPGCSHWSNDHDSANQNGRFKKSLQEADTMPSPSQIDPSVLRELPQDIRRQVENDMATRKKQTSHSALGVKPTVFSKHHSENESSIRQSGTEKSVHRSEQKTDSVKSAIVPLPSLSQLDESCLNALPEELQNEIRQAYIRQETDDIARCVPTLHLQQASSPSKKSPRKKHSPGKSHSPGQSRKSPNFKIPRSKPKRGRPKKLEFQSRRQPKITASVGHKQQQEPKVDKPTNRPGTADQPITDISHNDATSTDDVMPESAESTNQNAVNLCGAVTIAEVRTLLRDWLNSTPAPEQEDEDVMLTYLRDLVLDRNLEQVDLVIKFLNRNIMRLKNELWETSLQRIVQHIQCIVQATYGSKLKLPDKCSLSMKT